MGDQTLQFPAFGQCQFAVFTDREGAEMNIHDAYPIQFGDLVIQVFAHPSDLPVEALRQNDAKCVGPHSLYLTFFRDCPQDGEAIAHAVDEFLGDGWFDGDDILLVVFVSSTQDLVDNIAIIGEEDEPLGRFVQAANGEEALLVTDEGDDVFWLFRISGTDDAYRFIEGDIERLGFGFEGFAVDPDDITGRDPVAGTGGFIVDGDPAGIDQPVGVPTGADASFADVLVETDGIVVGYFQTKEVVDGLTAKSR